MNKKVFIKQDGTIPGHRIIEEFQRRNILNTIPLDGETKGFYVSLKGALDYGIGRFVFYSADDHTELLYNKETDTFYEKCSMKDYENSEYSKKAFKQIKNNCFDCTNVKGCINCQDGDMKETKSGRMVSAKAKEALLPDKFIGVDVAEEGEDMTVIAIPEGYEAIIEEGTIIVKKKWTIKDAKPGDILKTRSFVFIFKNIDKENGVHYYCAYEIEKHEDDEQFHVALSQSLMGRIDSYITTYQPASRNEIEKLNQFIAEAGYEWDAEKLELKKKKWEPKRGDVIWFASFNESYCEFVTDSYIWYEEDRLDMNDFSTKKEAQAFCDKLNAAIKNVIEERRKEVEK